MSATPPTRSPVPYWRRAGGPPRGGVRLLRPTASMVTRTAWNVRIYRREVVPRRGPLILAANHTGVLDGPLLHAVTQRPVHSLVKQEMFRGALGRMLLRVGQVPVDRFGYDPGAVKACLAVLDRGDVLGIYPEGTRGYGDFGRIKPGVAYLALCTGAPIVPVACFGVRESGSSVRSAPRFGSRIDVVFGRPFETAGPLAWPRRRDVVTEWTEHVRQRLAAHVQTARALVERDLPAAPIDATAEPPPVVPQRERVDE